MAVNRAAVSRVAAGKAVASRAAVNKEAADRGAANKADDKTGSFEQQSGGNNSRRFVIRGSPLWLSTRLFPCAARLSHFAMFFGQHTGRRDGRRHRRQLVL